MSVSSEGQSGYQASMDCEVTPDGRFVVFSSKADNLVPDDTNGTWDVFVHDRWSATTERVSLASDGDEADSTCGAGSISADGRFVAFESSAKNLVPGDTNGALDVFLRDRLLGTTTCISVSRDGKPGNATARQPSISGDGTRVCFESLASDLVAEDTNSTEDVFVRDVPAGVTRRVSVSSSGSQAVAGAVAPALSADGRWAAFASHSWDLVAGDTNGQSDLFVHDLLSGVTERVSLAWDGSQSNSISYEARLSPDGGLVLFTSVATNPVPGGSNGQVQVFARDRGLATTEQVSLASDGTQCGLDVLSMAISADSRWVAFSSLARDLVAGDTNSTIDVFLRDRVLGTTERVSMGFDGAEANGPSSSCSLDADGRRLVYSSGAMNLTPNDFNNRDDVFLVDRSGCEPTVGGYCKPSLTSIDGCLVTLTTSGVPSVAEPEGFHLQSSTAPGHQLGWLYWSTHGAANLPIGTQSGVLCATLPQTLSGPVGSGGHAGSCDGTFSFALLDLLRSAPGIDLGGATLHAGIWFRDTASADGFGLSDAVWFQVCP